MQVGAGPSSCAPTAPCGSTVVSPFIPGCGEVAAQTVLLPLPHPASCTWGPTASSRAGVGGTLASGGSGAAGWAGASRTCAQGRRWDVGVPAASRLQNERRAGLESRPHPQARERGAQGSWETFPRMHLGASGVFLSLKGSTGGRAGKGAALLRFYRSPLTSLARRLFAASQCPKERGRCRGAEGPGPRGRAPPRGSGARLPPPRPPRFQRPLGPSAQLISALFLPPCKICHLLLNVVYSVLARIKFFYFYVVKC